jgi:heme A synthase
MTIDLEVQRHQQIWEGFTRLLKYGSIAVIIILALLAIFVV